jgi:hypothetical protein
MLLLSSGSCSKDFLVAGRVTLIERAWTETYMCGKYHTNECHTDHPPAVHFLYDGQHFYMPQPSNYNLQQFRHWGCYWLRIYWNGDVTLVQSVIGPAPDQACAQ